MPLESVKASNRKSPYVSDTKSTSANAVTTARWESLKRGYFMRTNRTIEAAPAAASAPIVADPHAE